MAKELNKVELIGTVKKIIADNDKVCKFTLDVPTTTPNNKISHAFVMCADFNGNHVAEGDNVKLVGRLSTNSYNGKFTVLVVIDNIV